MFLKSSMIFAHPDTYILLQVHIILHSPTSATMTSLPLALFFLNFISAHSNSVHIDLSVNQTIPHGAVFLPLSTSHEVLCSLNSSHDKPIDYILFYRGEKLISNRFITVLDSTKVRIYIHSEVSSGDRFFGRFFHNSESTLTELTCANATVTPRPREVENFTCVSNALVNLTCTWVVFNDVPTIYKVYYTPVSESPPARIFHCPKNDPVHHKCTWTSDSNPPYLNDVEFFEFTVQGENEYGTRTQTFKIHHFAVVTAPAPSSLVFVDRTPFSVLLKWWISNQNFEPGWLFYVSYTFAATTFTFSKIYHQRELLILDNEVWLNITDLPYANTDYTVKVFMKAPAASDDYWSAPAIVTIKTSPCVPYQAPLTMIGGFHLVNVTNANRIMDVYWRPILQTERNGDDFYYEVTVFKGNEALEVISLQANERSFRHAIDFEAHRFVFRSGNEEGVSAASSEVYVPEEFVDPVLAAEVRNTINNTNELLWQTRTAVDNFTVFWCKTHGGLCKEIVEFTYTGGNNARFEVPFHRDHRFAISANSAKSSSGLSIPACFIYRDQIGAVKKLQAVQVGSYDLVISWAIDCHREAALLGIRGYSIHYCVAENGLCLEPELIASHKKVETLRTTISGLRPFSVYRISVSALLMEGVGSRSEYLYQRTAEGAPDLDGFDFVEKNVSDSWIQLQWSPPTRMNGVFQHYRVSYNNKDTIVHDNRIMLASLKSNTNYSIRVYACTSKCSTPIGPQVIKTKAHVGRAEYIKSQRVNATHIRLSWDSIPTQDKESEGHSLRIQFEDGNSTVGNNGEVILPSSSKGNEKAALISVAAG